MIVDDTGVIAKVTKVSLPREDITPGKIIAKELEIDHIEDGVELRIDLDPEGV